MKIVSNKENRVVTLAMVAVARVLEIKNSFGRAGRNNKPRLPTIYYARIKTKTMSGNQPHYI